MKAGDYVIHDVNIPISECTKGLITDIKVTFDFKPSEFVRINSIEKNDPSFVARISLCMVDGKPADNCLHVIYERGKSHYLLSLYAVTVLLYRSIMYLRHLPIKKYLFIYEAIDKEKLWSELNNAEILLSILKKGRVFMSDFSEISFDIDDIDRFALIELGQEYCDCAWDLSAVRVELISDIEKQLSKVKNAYKYRQYKKIRELGYDIHNFPEMIRINKRF